MAKVAHAQEPSMEEILASIRRIISDEETSVAQEPAQPEAAATGVAESEPAEIEEADLEEVLELSEAQMTSTGIEAAEEEEADIAFLEQEEEPPAPPPLPEPARAVHRPESVRRPEPKPDPVIGRAPTEPQPEPRQLLSPNADAVVTSAFNSLAHTILSSQARTLEDLVKDMLRPMLKAWLDTNLPPLVERLVRNEIERVSRGGR